MDINYAAIGVVCGFILLDVISGIAKAAMQHELSSSVMRQGLCHKAAYMLVIVLALLCQFASGVLPFGEETALVFDVVFVWVCVYIMLAELVSVLENLCAINPELASTKLLKLFAIVKEPDENERGNHAK